jgi:hypothetical protein
MCTDQGLGFRNLLNEVASHGYDVIANGAPTATGKASDKKILTSLNWIYQNAGTEPLAHVDKTRIAAAGQSCGGWQAYKASLDKRVKLTRIFDSGGNMGGGSFSVKQLHAPVGYFLGGTSDMAYRPVRREILLVVFDNTLMLRPQGTNDYNNLPANVRAVLVNNPRGGHMKDMMTKQGGLVAVAGRSFLDWVFKNSSDGREMLLGKSSRLARAGWQIKHKGFK